MLEMVGGSLTGLTVSRKLVELVPPLASVTVKVIVVAPNWFCAGVSVTVRLLPLPPRTIFELGTRAGFEELPVTTRLPAGVSISPTVKAIAPLGVSSLMATLAIAEMVGRSLTDNTVRMKEPLVVAAPSLTLKVIVVVPNWFAAGVIVAMRLAPLPLKTMFPTGTRPALEDAADKVMLPGAVSTSPTTKGTARGVSSFVV